MTTGRVSQRTYFAQALEACCTQAGYNARTLAACMIRHHFPSHQYSGHPRNSSADEAWLAERIQQLQDATHEDEVPFDGQMADFVRSAALCLPMVVGAKKYLLNAMLRDDWERFNQV
jgi:hypothetical protein